MHLVQKRQKQHSTKHNKQPEAYITHEQYEEPIELGKAPIVPVRRTYSEATQFGKNICVIADSHLNRINRNIFQNSVNRGEHTLIFFKVLHLRD